MSARRVRSARGDVVRVAAQELSNGAPHPMHGRTGVVLEVRAKVPHPVRVHLAGQPGLPARTVMLAHNELERVILTVAEAVAGDEWDADEAEAECAGHESLDGARMGETVYCDGTCLTAVPA